MALKQDEDFLRFLTMGAVGTAAVLETLNKRHGHRAIELERYATANKLWETKIKRLRLADLICLDCGIRVEVRAKSKLAIRMSHSEIPGREWDAGLRDEDFVAFVAWRPGSAVTADDQQLFRIDAMRSARDFAKLGPRKAASEGAERDISWPARVPKRDGIVEAIDCVNGTVRYRPTEGRRNTYRLPDGMPVHIYVSEGQILHGGEQFLLGCVAVPKGANCSGSTWNFARDLQSKDPIDRYVAVKAAGIDGARTAEGRLAVIADDPDEDERICLEAMGSLARIDPGRYIDRLTHSARRPTNGNSKEMALSMESVFILSELDSPAAAEALATLALDSTIDSETRCAAVWGLGTAGIDDPGQILPFIADPDDDVALHALAGIGELSEKEIAVLRGMLENGSDREAASAATLLREEAEVGIPLLLEIAQHDGRAGERARAALGETPEAEVRGAMSGGLPPELDTVLSPMWVSQENWLNRQRAESPLDFLRQQRIRHLGQQTA